jgi:hypothetical protein
MEMWPDSYVPATAIEGGNEMEMWHDGSTYKIHEMTVVVNHGRSASWWDLNAGGEPCETVEDLLGFVDELEDQGAFDVATRDELKRTVMARSI